MSLRKLVFAIGLFSALGIVASFTVGGKALAYGKADEPLAQIEFSGNCTNPDFPFCAPPPDGVGLGGIWLWIEVDAGDASGGTADLTGSVCDHTFAGAPHGALGLPINGETTWTYTSLADAVANGYQVLPGIDTDPTATYYAVEIPGNGPYPGETLVFPTAPGHYAFTPAPGVTLQLQVAP